MSDHTEPLDALLARLGTDPKRGLKREEAQTRLERDGTNRLSAEEAHLKSQYKLLLCPKYSLPVFAAVICAALAISFFQSSGSFYGFLAIFVIVASGLCIRVVQGRWTRKHLDSLKKKTAPTSRVLRSGSLLQIPSAQVVQGDMLLLEAGDLIPADLRLTQSASLRCDERALTGRCEPVGKDAYATIKEYTPLDERKNMAFAGCSVLYGKGLGVAVATGANTQIAQPPHSPRPAQAESARMPMMAAVEFKWWGLALLAGCAAILVAGLFYGGTAAEAVAWVGSFLTAAVPLEAAAALATVRILGIRRMAQQDILIRQPSIVEKFAGVSVICAGKSGVFTSGRLSVQRVWAANHQPQELAEGLTPHSLHVLRMAAMCGGDINVQGEENPHGVDPIDSAIAAAALEQGLDKRELEREYPRLADIPFDSGRKCMTTIHRIGYKTVAIVKGSGGSILPQCKQSDLQRAAELLEEMGSSGLRVLAVACREIPAAPYEPAPQRVETDLTFVGLIGLGDPIREDARDAIPLCKKAGIRPLLVTGDHLATACAVARDLELWSEGGISLSGSQMAQENQGELDRLMQGCLVFAEMVPGDKTRIIEAWRNQGAVVAVTGVRPDDLPLLKGADVGCAVGGTAPDAVVCASPMVFFGGGLSSVVKAVGQCRGITRRMGLCLQFLLGTCLGEMTAILLAALIGWGTPLLLIHILLVNVVLYIFPAYALSLEPNDPDILNQPPQQVCPAAWKAEQKHAVLLQGLTFGFLILAGYYIGQFVDMSEYFTPSPQTGMTMGFLVLALSQLVHACNCRSHRSLLDLGFLSNESMIKAFLATLIVLITITSVPPLQTAFGLASLSMAHWLAALGLSLVPLPVFELYKAFVAICKRII